MILMILIGKYSKRLERTFSSNEVSEYCLETLTIVHYNRYLSRHLSIMVDNSHNNDFH